MLRIGALRLSVLARARRVPGGRALEGARACFSGGLPTESNDDSTPAKTKLAFTSTVYGKDPSVASELTPSQVALAEKLKKSATTSTFTHGPVSKGNDPKAMFDSSLAQQADDGKASGTISRDVVTNTPEASRVAFRTEVYGKDPQASAELSEQEIKEVEVLRSRIPHVAPGVAPVHDERNMFDSELVHGVASMPASDSIKRDVSADTPDTTRLVFGGSDYGKDPQSMARTPEEQAEMDALAVKAAGKGGTSSGAAPIHHQRSMFDSDLTHNVGGTVNPDAIKREVSADTPDTTRLVFGGSDYGKDPQSMARTPEEQAEMDDLAIKAAGKGGTGSGAAPIHHQRSMFDSDLTHNVGGTVNPDAIKREVSADTPDTTRLVFGGSDYGKDPQSMARTPEEQDEMDALAIKAAGKGGTSSGAAPIHHQRSMFDSDLTHSVGGTVNPDAIKREVSADTPDITRLVFGGSDYGKDPQSMARTPEEQAEMDDLAIKAAGKEGTGSGAAPIHHQRSMFDSDLTHSVGGKVDPDAIKREVSADTPDTTRLVFGGSDYGKDPQSMGRTPEEQAEMDTLAARDKEFQDSRRVMAPIHHQRSMFDSDLSQGAGETEGFDAVKRDVASNTPELTRLSFFGSTYGDVSPVDEHAEAAQELAKKQAKGAKLMAVGRGTRGSKIHDTKRAMKDDDYRHEGAE